MKEIPTTINIRRAVSIGEIHPASVTLCIHDQLQDDECKWMQSMQEFYSAQGKLLSDALFSSLPGGTVDALLGELMRRRASLFSVPFPRGE